MKEGWEYKKLGEVCNTSSGGTPSKSHMEYYEGGTIPWLRSGEVAQGLIYSTELCITDLGMKNSSAKLFPIDTVVIAMYGATVGQVGILKKEMTTNQAICGVFPNKIFYPMFLFYCLKAKKSFFIKDAVGGAQPNISQNLIKKTEVPVPPLAEQHHIVEELDLLSSIIEKKKAQLKELDNLAQSLFYEKFGDPVNNEKSWELSSLKMMGEIGRGVSKHRPRNAPELLGGTMPLIQTGDVANAEMYIRAYNSTYSDLGVSQSKIWKSGTLCITIAATIGKCAILGFDACFPDSVVGFTVNKSICNNEYVYFIFRRLQAILEENAPAVAQKNINLKVLSDLDIPLPPLELQNQFAKKVQAIEHQKELIKQSIKEVETLFNSRMDYYFN